MKMLKEFKEFALRGNVLDLAVGLIMGAAFGKIVSAMVSDVLMPPIGKLLGNVNFSDLFICLDPAKSPESLAQAKKDGVAVIAYGAFLSTVVDFLIIAWCIFLLVKAVNTVQRKIAKEEPSTTKECPYCISKIAVKASRCPNCTSELPAAEPTSA